MYVYSILDICKLRMLNPLRDHVLDSSDLVVIMDYTGEPLDDMRVVISRAELLQVKGGSIAV
jgi:hypothetical protein